MTRHNVEETLGLAGTTVGFLVTNVLLRRFRPPWTLQFAVVTFGLLLFVLLLLLVVHRGTVWQILVYCMAVLLGVYVAVFFIDHRHVWDYLGGALLFAVLALAELAYLDRRERLHARTSEQQTSTTEDSEE